LVASSQSRQILYAHGLFALDHLAHRKHRRKFVELTQEQQMGLLRKADQVRHYPPRPSIIGKIARKAVMLYYKWRFPAVDLFPRLVQDVFQCFYTSQVSWIWLGYDGPPMPRGYPGLLDKPSDPQELETSSWMNEAPSGIYLDDHHRAGNKE
jgi:hypothetical protein